METVPTVECAKCGHLNPQDECQHEHERKCEDCGHHLYVLCPDCGQVVLRVARQGHQLREHGLPEADVDSPLTESTGLDLKVALTAFASVGLLILGVLVWMGMVEPLLKQLAEDGEVRILGRPVGPSGLAKLGFLAFVLGCVFMGLVVSVLSSLIRTADDRGGKSETVTWM